MQFLVKNLLTGSSTTLVKNLLMAFHNVRYEFLTGLFAIFSLEPSNGLLCNFQLSTFLALGFSDVALVG